MSHSAPAKKTATRRKTSKKTAAKPAESGPVLLEQDRFEWVEAWGMASKSMASVYRPSTIDGIREVFAVARRTGRTIAQRGGGRSYGDAFQNAEEIVLDLSRMTRVLAWNPDDGIIDLEPGVSIAQLWRYIVEDGWWPPVVSGTMFTTMGGCLGMNIHGKNAYRLGTFGEHVQEFDLLLPNGDLLTVTRENDYNLFRGAISGFGMMGVITRIRLKLKKVYSGNLEVFPQSVRNFYEMAEAFEENADKMDYMVGWNDCFPTRQDLIGRGEMHFAKYIAPGADPMPHQTLRLVNQEVPDTLMGFFPKSIMWRALKFYVNDWGMRLVNTAKFYAQMRPGGDKPYLQSHGAFHFLLDYVPNWKWSYKPGGLIQYQSFVPREAAPRVFTEQVKLCHKAGIHPYLGVTKKHVPDDFLISHAVDGYSLALDFPVTERNRKGLWKLCHQMDDLVLENGGRFYFAKDSTMRAGTAARYLPEGNLQLFRQLKERCDPDGLLSSNLYRRIFG